MKKFLKNTLKVFVAILLIAAVIAGYLFRQIGKKPDIHAYNSFSYYSDGQFVSPPALTAAVPKVYATHSSVESPGWSRFFLKSPNAPESALPKVMLKKSDFPDKPDSFSVYWLGHCSAIVELNGVRMVIDPVFGNAGPLPGITKRYDKAPLKRDEMPDVDFVILTHNHYDHLEYATMRFFRNNDVRFIVPLGVDVILKGWGIPEEKIYTMAWNDSLSEKGIEITALPVIHYSSRSWSDRNATLWVSYVFSGGGKKIYWSGDTGYGNHFAETGAKYGPFDLAFIEIDGWDPRWADIHLFPEEAVQACIDVNAKILLPVHWAVFDLALHPWNESIQKVVDIAQKEGIEVATPIMGEKFIPGVTKTKHWW
jgi:Predicted Zn-dependent hydrolases of the beta-lactamase fold